MFTQQNTTLNTEVRFFQKQNSNFNRLFTEAKVSCGRTASWLVGRINAKGWVWWSWCRGKKYTQGLLYP